MAISAPHFDAFQSTSSLQLIPLQVLRQNMEQHLKKFEKSLKHTPQNTDYRDLQQQLQIITQINKLINDRIEEELLDQRKQGCGDRILTRLGAKGFRDWVSYTNSGIGGACGTGAAIIEARIDCPKLTPAVVLQIIQIGLSAICGGLNFFSKRIEDSKKKKAEEEYRAHKKKEEEEKLFSALLEATAKLDSNRGKAPKEGEEGEEDYFQACLHRLRGLPSQTSIPDAKFWVPFLVEKLDDQHRFKQKLNEVQRTAFKIANYQQSAPMHHDPLDPLALSLAVPGEQSLHRRMGLMAQAAPSQRQEQREEMPSDLESEGSLESLKLKYHTDFSALQDELDLPMSHFPLAEERHPILLDADGEIVDEGDLLARQDSEPEDVDDLDCTYGSFAQKGDPRSVRSRVDQTVRPMSTEDGRIIPPNMFQSLPTASPSGDAKDTQ